MMEYQFSDRVQNLKPSAIREIFKYAADPEVVSLSAGNPAPEAFPSEQIAEISSRILREHPVDALVQPDGGLPRTAADDPRLYETHAQNRP